jgi:anti-sigma regulatory factor (Ser/Thr protein kinase)
MRERLWERRPVPAPGPGAVRVGCWRPSSPAGVTACRRQLAAVLTGGAGAAADGAVDRLLLCVEELASNAVRHGRGPVRVTVTAAPGHWLLEVRDAAGEAPPSPAVDRDPAEGGLGLHLVARLGQAHGWTSDGTAKVSWVRVDRTAPEVLAVGPAPRGVEALLAGG